MTEKLNGLVEIKKSLLANNILDESQLDSFKSKTIYTINKMPVPSYIKAKEVIDISFEFQSDKEVMLKRRDTTLDASYCAYEEVIALLRERVSINDIVILNSNTEDDYNFLKIFHDARIPIVINKNIKLNTYPEVINLQRIIKNDGYSASKEYLNNLVKSDKDSIYLPVLIKIYNKYLDENLDRNTDLLIALINNQTVNQKKYTNCINVYSVDDFSYSKSKYYIIMNYSDSSLPKIANNSHYLNISELKEIKYLDEYLLNEYYERYYSDLIKKIDNLCLIFTKYGDEENRLASLELNRKITQEEYSYIVKDFSYFNSLTQLEFAKTKYDYNTFFLRHPNYRNLYKDYNHLMKDFNHDFTGIKSVDLNALLTKNNSITPYKLESYTQCQFQYLLKNLLKLDVFETNISQYLGNLSHKVLEEFTIDPTVDYNKLVDDFEGIPIELKHKEKIFKEAIKLELAELIKIIDRFHTQTLFKEIKPEIQFRFPFKHDPSFDISL